MTEDEAKTKWCPMARVIMGSRDNKSFEPAFNRMVLDAEPDVPRIGGSTMCLASACIMWEPTRKFVSDKDKSKPDILVGHTEYGGDCGLKQLTK